MTQVSDETRLEWLQRFLDKQAVTEFFSAKELCMMRKANNAIAVPPEELWPNMVNTLHVAQEIRREIGKPLRVGNGYRPRDYNKAVGGARNSTHIYFRALDLDLIGDARKSSGFRKFFYEVACEMYLKYGDGFKMGLGFYSPRGGARVHIDTGKKKRYWKRKYVKPILNSLR